MDKLESLKILKQLADGIDPYTGEVLPEHSPYQQPQTVRALFCAIKALEDMKDSAQKVAPGFVNAGKSWEAAEDEQLTVEFDSGMSIRELSRKHQRTAGAIQARLIRLGKLPKTPYSYSALSDKHTSKVF